MGEQPQFTSEAVDWRDIGDQIMAGFLRSIANSATAEEAQKQVLHAVGQANAFSWNLLIDGAILAGKGIHGIEEVLAPFLAAFVAPIIGGLFGAEVNAAEFTRRLGSGEGAPAAQAIVKGLMEAIAGNVTGEIQPSDEGARRIASAAVAASLESTFNAAIPEIASHFIPLGLGHFEDLMELPENIIRTLGIGRLVRQALRPLVATTCSTPMQWHIDKLHRPTLLSPASAARQIARGFGNKETWLEDMRRAGYSEERIAAIQNEQAHYFGAGDVRTFVSRGWWTSDRGLKHLRDQGYDEDAATDALRLEGLRRIEQLEAAQAHAIISAYVAGDIDRSTFGAALGASVTVPSEVALLTLEAETRKAMNVKHLSLGQVEAMVKSGVLSVPDYRDAARREGYDDGAVTALELQLRYEMDKVKDVETHRKELEAARAAEQKAKADAAAAKKAELEAQRAADRRGRRVDLERAAIRGLVSLDRVQEIYAAAYDPDTVATLMELLAGDRQAYLDQQTARDEAAKRAIVRGIDVGALEAAVTEGVLTLAELRDRLAQLHFTAADAGILVDTLAAKIQDRDDAEAEHDRAAAAAKVKHVSLDVVELLVRRGHRTLAQYDAVLSSLGFDDGARAAMVERLQVLIDDDAKARDAHAAAEATARAKGLSFEQARRAVLLGVSSIDAFQTFMVTQGFTPDAQQVLLAELRFDVAEADAARRRRAEADAAKDSRDAPVSDVARAARLGLIPVAVYQDRLVRSGYSDDDVAIEIDLLVHEMTEDAAARDRRVQADAAAQSRGLSLTQTERAVRAGRATLDMYRATAVTSGLSADAADTLVALLRDELEAQTAAEQRRRDIAAAAAVKRISLQDLEAAVKAGLASLDDYRAAVLEAGYADDDAALLVGLLARSLAAIDEARRRRDALAAAQPEREASLAQFEQGVKDGLIDMRTFVTELTARGYGQAPLLTIDADGRAVLDESSDGPFDDAELIALLLQVQLDAKAAKGGG